MWSLLRVKNLTVESQSSTRSVLLHATICTAHCSLSYLVVSHSSVSQAITRLKVGMMSVICTTSTTDTSTSVEVVMFTFRKPILFYLLQIVGMIHKTRAQQAYIITYFIDVQKNNFRIFFLHASINNYKAFDNAASER